MRICVSKIENRITFKIKTPYCLELLMTETIKLLGSTKNKITKDENGENVPYLEITEVVLVYCNDVSSDYLHDSKILCTFASNKLFGRLLDILPKYLISKKVFNSEFSYIELWFTDQIFKSLKIEDKIEFTLVIK